MSGSIRIDHPEGLLSKRKVLEERPEIRREKFASVSVSDRFTLTSRNFSNEYFEVYCQRLQALRPALEAAATKRWNAPPLPPFLPKTVDIKPKQHAIMIGVLIKELKLLPTTLEQFSKERSILPIPQKISFLDESDKVWIEDDTGRILLSPKPATASSNGSWKDMPFDISSFSHGTIIAVKGMEQEGVLLVEDLCVAGAPPQPNGPVISSQENPSGLIEGNYIVLTSGFAGASPLSMQMMLNYIEGHLGSTEESRIIKNITRVIIAGKCFPQRKKQQRSVMRQKLRSKQNESDEKRDYINILRDLDVDLSNLACSVPVDLMPGQTDPTNYTMPHQPLNYCLLPLSYRISSFTCVTSPYSFTLKDTIMLGMSGESVQNLKQFVSTQDTLLLAEHLLSIRHIAPTSPDTLAAYPSDADPFILDVCPHVLFIGDQPSFSTKLFTGDRGQQTRIISVPNFAKTSSIVLLHVDTLACFPMNFSVLM